MIKDRLIDFLNINDDRRMIKSIERQLIDIAQKIEYLEERIKIMSADSCTTREKAVENIGQTIEEFKRGRGRPKKMNLS